jgi:hypothetical protein
MDWVGKIEVATTSKSIWYISMQQLSLLLKKEKKEEFIRDEVVELM